MTTRPRVLVVDGHADRASDTREALAARDWTVDVAADADAALTALGNDDVACIVCEREVGDDVGLELLDTVRGIHEDVPFVVLTGDGDEAYAERAVSAGVTDYVRRVDDWRDRLVDAVADALDAGRDRAGRLKERALDEAPVGITIADANEPDMPLVYVNDAFTELTGYPREAAVGDNCRFLQGEDSDPAAIAQMREAIEAEEPVSVELVNYTRDGERFWNRVDIAPVRDTDGEVTHYAGFQTDVTERVEAERRAEQHAANLDAERESLQHLLERIDGLIGDAGQALVEATTREGVEAAMCDLLVDNDPYTCAWIGEPDLADKSITPSTITGGRPGGPGLDLAGDEDPVGTAIETGAVQVVDVDDVADWHRDRVSDEFTTLAAIPLAYRDARYGAMCVYVDDASALDDREVTVLDALGRMTATAISAAETLRTLTADNVVSLAFTVRNRDAFFVQVADRAEVELTYAGSVHRDDDDHLGMFFTVETDDVDALRAVAADVDGVADCTVVTANDGAALVEFGVDDAGLLSTLADYGADIREITARPGEATVEVELPRDANARSLVDHVEDAFADVELTAYRERERPAATKQEFIADLEDQLTDRQLTALRRAYFGEFFEWPRPTSGDDLADSMGIARSTYHQHLRAAERKLVGEFFDRP